MDCIYIISNYINGRKALDFGCGTGRSTRFLRNIGFDTTGIDIAADMINKAREILLKFYHKTIILNKIYPIPK